MANKLILMLLAFTPLVWASQDPTAPLNWQKAPVTTTTKKVVSARVPNLQSIVCGENKSCSATLNGRNMSIGESIDGFSVKQINADYVMVTRGSKQWKLELFPLEIKQ
ncbi:MSHA biogenesis protein MshK [Vibrio taketomensis]|uniref:MSHA biogenesis protein MshK n=1 Tax=Vibrio taketomensis TaxID=2572923 RepID=UPI001E30882B|nr:MSHA biogenesis protein MshK [Vibrio taketomensis]